MFQFLLGINFRLNIISTPGFNQSTQFQFLLGINFRLNPLQDSRLYRHK
ncbi:hypothetical protein H1P_3420003 [Hyella patelloides LEGE 07179]|uniref:Uncharacterized protein n=1 Tax=Hyella patelloides LEGE 07179 TaxID=945734 RepID=A0A563VVT3_9CYAN|nr:hypothetical protein H1P_3420003 [Hyella patelloides LEGE 07179]